MPVISMACPKCGKQATEYAENKWQCLHCGRKFLYEESKAPIIITSAAPAYLPSPESSSGADSLSIASQTPAMRYRALCPPAVASVALGALSITTALHWALAAIPLAGIVLGWQARKRIRRAPDEWTGLRLAQVGMGLSVGLWVVGYGWLLFAGAKEVPFGYSRVTYEMLQPDPNMPTALIPPSATDMNDKKVYIKGYMQPRRKQSGIKEFILCPNNGDCPFCIPNPLPTEKIRVVLQGDMETVYTNRLIGVAGKFQVNPGDSSGVPYGLDADYLR